VKRRPQVRMGFVESGLLDGVFMNYDGVTEDMKLWAVLGRVLS